MKEPLDTTLCFDKESLDLAFKYFMSPTLTMRLAGLSQITVSYIYLGSFFLCLLCFTTIIVIVIVIVIIIPTICGALLWGIVLSILHTLLSMVCINNFAIFPILNMMKLKLRITRIYTLGHLAFLSLLSFCLSFSMQKPEIIGP